MVLLIMGRELRGVFNGHAGYVILAAHLLITGLRFNVYAVGATPRCAQEVWRVCCQFGSGRARGSGRWSGNESPRATWRRCGCCILG